MFSISMRLLCYVILGFMSLELGAAVTGTSKLQIHVSLPVVDKSCPKKTFIKRTLSFSYFYRFRFYIPDPQVTFKDKWIRSQRCFVWYTTLRWLDSVSSLLLQLDTLRANGRHKYGLADTRDRRAYG
jgi:hypothetical protein